jgi:molecular chaperone DnaJ
MIILLAYKIKIMINRMGDLYDILGVDKNSTPDEIKKKYRDLAKQHHPDKGGDAEMFKKIQDAYDTLSNPQKKQQYDNPRQSQHFEFDMSDFFQGFGFGFDSNFAHSGNPFQRENLDINLTHHIPLKHIYQDIKADISFIRQCPCGRCDGVGYEVSDDSVECLHCEGSGRQQRHGMNIICDYCNGSGQIHSKKCSTCNGEKLKPKHDKVTVDNIFVLGVEPQTLTYRGYGNFSKHKAKRGNLHITLMPENSKNYIRSGVNLLYVLDIDYRLAISGGEVEYKHLDDKTYKIKIPEKSNKGSKFKLSGKGMLNRDKTSRGDLIIELSLIIDYTIE